MFTQRNTENERGALMMEAVALLGLMTMMSPMVVRQTAERTSEMEEVAVAGQMKELRDGLSNYIEANYGTLTGNKTQNEVRTDITASMLAPFLPAGAVQDGKFLGNKMVFNSADSDATSPFRVAATAQCTERKNGGTTQVCATPGGCALGSGWTCNRYRITGMVLSNGAEELDDRRASRIASMIGADGGFMRSSKANTALAATNEAKRKIYGAQGIWEGDTDVFFGAGNINADHGGRIAATTVFTSGASGDFLYRTQQDGIPGANSMFTDLDMGGNHVNCGGAGQPACHKINNAGGLEVVNGRILVRSANNNVQAGSEGSATDAAISLAADQSYISAGSSNISINDSKIILNAANPAGRLELLANNKIYMKTDGGDIDIQVHGSGNAFMGSMSGRAKIDGKYAEVHGSETVDLESGGMFNVASAGALNLYSKDKATLNAEKKLGLISNTDDVELSAAKNAWIKGNDHVFVTTTDQNSKMTLNATSAGIVTNRADVYGAQTANMRTAGSGLFMNDADDHLVELKSDGGWGELTMQNGNVDLYAEHAMDLNALDSMDLSAAGSSIALDEDGLFLNGSPKVKATASKTVSGSDWRGDFELKHDTFKMYVGAKMVNGAVNKSTAGLFNLGTYGADITTQTSKLRLDSQGLHIHTNDDQPSRLTFYNNRNNYTAGITLAQYENRNNQRALVISDAAVNAGALGSHHHEEDSPIALYGKTGRIDASFFQVKKIYNRATNGSYSWMDPVRSNYSLKTWENGYASTKSYGIGDNFDATNATANGFHNHGLVWVNDGYVNADNAYKPSDNNDFAFTSDRMKNFRVDPAFVSVMNDIRLTSRGGAKLSKALPNYILKGIYVLTNSYTDGGWPCGEGPSKCTYTMPHFTAEELGLGRGGYEFHCTGDDVGDGSAGNPPPHPMMGLCDASHQNDNDGHGYVTFGYPKSWEFEYGYTDHCTRADGACWAHPFMGMVPVPGKSFSVPRVKADGSPDPGKEWMYAFDEGECPAGYMPVMTVTPNIFELGRINAIKRSIAASGQVYLSNPGYQNFYNNQTYKFVNIYQMGTKLGIVVKPICKVDNWYQYKYKANCSGSDRTLQGWAVAMGTVTQDNTDPGSYIWNVGGIYTNSWQATAHTYCYFNPARFIMPNMESAGGSDGWQRIDSMENPLLLRNASKVWLDE